MYVMYLDESGDHSLNRIDPQFPVFVLAGCIFDQDEHDRRAAAELRQFKRTVLGREDIVLHTADITRNRRGFERMKDPAFRQRFYAAINALIDGLDFTVVACAIHKERHSARYGPLALDPYDLSLDCLVERYVYFLRERDAQGQIVVESRNPALDKQLDLAYQLLLTRGTRYVRPSRLRQSLTGLSVRLKQENIAGLQVADLVATPIARAVLGKEIKEDFRVVERKLRRREGSYRRSDNGS